MGDMAQQERARTDAAKEIDPAEDLIRRMTEYRRNNPNRDFGRES